MNLNKPRRYGRKTGLVMQGIGEAMADPERKTVEIKTDKDSNANQWDQSQLLLAIAKQIITSSGLNMAVEKNRDKGITIVSKHPVCFEDEHGKLFSVTKTS